MYTSVVALAFSLFGEWILVGGDMEGLVVVRGGEEGVDCVAQGRPYTHTSV